MNLKDILYKCPKCGNSYSNINKYCPECGEKINFDLAEQIVKIARAMLNEGLQKSFGRDFVWVMGSDVKKIYEAQIFSTDDGDVFIGLPQAETFMSYPVIYDGKYDELSLYARVDSISIFDGYEEDEEE